MVGRGMGCHPRPKDNPRTWMRLLRTARDAVLNATPPPLPMCSSTSVDSRAPGTGHALRCSSRSGLWNQQLPLPTRLEKCMKMLPSPNFSNLTLASGHILDPVPFHLKQTFLQRPHAGREEEKTVAGQRVGAGPRRWPWRAGGSELACPEVEVTAPCAPIEEEVEGPRLLLESLSPAAGPALRSSLPCLRWLVMLTNFPHARWPPLHHTDGLFKNVCTSPGHLCPWPHPPAAGAATVEYRLAFPFKILDLGVFFF